MLKIRVFGVPAPQGSKRGYAVRGRVNMVEQAHKTLKPWREDVSDAAAKVMDGRDRLDGDLFVSITFFMKRPKSVKRPYPNVAPDVDKMTRGVLDALKFGDVYVDDARVVACMALKEYAKVPEEQGALIIVRHFAEVSEWWYGLAERTGLDE
jgi:Holliday junction resolvase RusA-like endonuclease